MNNTLDENSKPLSFKFLTAKDCQKCQLVSVLLIIFLSSIGVLYLFYALPHLISKGDFQIVSADSYEFNDGIAIDADLKMDFPDAVVEALENGIPLTIAVEVQVILEQPWWRDIIIKDSRKLFELRYHPLTNVHEVKNIATNERYSFDSRQDAMVVLGTIRGAHLIEKKELIKNNQYIIQLRSMLDISHLPPALRQVASLSPSWRLESEWYRWKIQNNVKAQSKLETVKKIDFLPKLLQRAALPASIQNQAKDSELKQSVFKKADSKGLELKPSEFKTPLLQEQEP